MREHPLAVHLFLAWNKLRQSGSEAVSQQQVALKTADIAAQPLRGLVAGLGIMGSHHLRVLLGVEGAEVAAVVDPDAERRAAAQRLWPPLQAYERLEEALNAETLDFAALI